MVAVTVRFIRGVRYLYLSPGVDGMALRDELAGIPRKPKREPRLCECCGATLSQRVGYHQRHRRPLCHQCASIVGHADNDPNVLERVLTYLRQNTLP